MVANTVFQHASEEQARAEKVLATLMAAAQSENPIAYFDLGVAFSTGTAGLDVDLIEAHKWFNLAAVAGHEPSQMCRSEISEEMTAREIAEAQRRARAWLAETGRRAA